MKFLLLFFYITCLNACNDTSSHKGNKMEAVTNGKMITVRENKDTLILTTKTDSLNKQVSTEEIKPYKKQLATTRTAKPNAILKKVFYLFLPEGTPVTYKNISNLV